MSKDDCWLVNQLREAAEKAATEFLSVYEDGNALVDQVKAYEKLERTCGDLAIATFGEQYDGIAHYLATRELLTLAALQEMNDR